MAGIDFKNYTSRAKDLEIAILTQKRIMREHERIIKSTYPIYPQKENIQPPIQPQLQDYLENVGIDVGFISALVFMIFVGVCGIVGLFFVGLNLPVIASILLGLVGTVFVYVEVDERKSKKKANEKSEETYKKNCAKYPELLNAYKVRLAQINETYQQEIANYKRQVQQYNVDFDTKMRSHKALLISLEKSLQNLYAENVIYPKYRNLVAITTINEYLISGRCYELGGPSGAYNLYELELRENVVSSDLSAILENIDAISFNQYALYEELTKSEKLVNDIVAELRDFKSEAKLAAYFNTVRTIAGV